MDIQFIDMSSPLGDIRLAVTDCGLRGCYFHGQKYFPENSGWTFSENHPLLIEVSQKLEAYFSGNISAGDVRFDMQGTPFQLKVWRALLKIPYGTVTTYGELACSLGQSQAVRAVAAAIGRNPISVFVPCHRVIGKNGALTGYAGGLQRKQCLLNLEKLGQLSGCA